MRRAILAGMVVLAGVGLLVSVSPGEDVKPAAAGAGDAISLRACGLQIVGQGAGEGGDALLPLGTYRKGTTVAVVATAAKGRFIEFSSGQSKVTRFADDKGTNLLTGQVGYGEAGLSSMVSYAKDRKAAMLEVRSATQPAAGASHVVIEGTAAFLFSPDDKVETVKLENVELKPGTKLAAGPIKLSLNKAGKPTYGDEPFQVSFGSKNDVHAIKSMKFLDADGKEIGSRQSSIGMAQMGNEATFDIDYMLKAKADKATVVIEYWSDATTVKAPVNLKVGIGL